MSIINDTKGHEVLIFIVETGIIINEDKIRTKFYGQNGTDRIMN